MCVGCSKNNTKFTSTGPRDLARLTPLLLGGACQLAGYSLAALASLPASPWRRLPACRLRLGGAYQLVGQVRGEGLVAQVGPGERADALGHRPQVDGVAAEFQLRDLRLDQSPAAR